MHLKTILMGSASASALVLSATPAEDMAVNMADMAYMRYHATKRLATNAPKLAELVEQAEAIAGD